MSALNKTSLARRRYIRHPAEIPIDVSATSPGIPGDNQAHDISQGGLSFTSKIPFNLNDIILLTIRLTNPNFEEKARVIWCHPSAEGFDIGVEFIEPDVGFRMRMVEQVCHIEQFRRAQSRKLNREISPQQAAMEWIAKYAADFPQRKD